MSAVTRRRRRAGSARSSSQLGGREGDDESLGKMETFSAQVFPPPRSFSLSHSFPPPHSKLPSSSPPSRGISHSEKGVCIMPCSLRRPRKAPPALTRSENPIFTAAKKNERNGKEKRRDTATEREREVHNCFTIPHRGNLLSPCFGSCCCHSIHVLKTPTRREGEGSVFTNPYLTTGIPRRVVYIQFPVLPLPLPPSALYSCPNGDSAAFSPGFPLG